MDFNDEISDGVLSQALDMFEQRVMPTENNKQGEGKCAAIYACNWRCIQ